MLLWGFTEKSYFFRGEGVHELKGGGGVWTVFRFKGGRGSGKKRWGVLSLILEDKVHALTLPNQLTPKQI